MDNMQIVRDFGTFSSKWDVFIKLFPSGQVSCQVLVHTKQTPFFVCVCFLFCFICSFYLIGLVWLLDFFCFLLCGG